MAEPKIFQSIEELEAFIQEKPDTRSYLQNAPYIESLLIDLCNKYAMSYTEFIKQAEKITMESENPFVTIQQIIWDKFNLDYTDFVDFPKLKKLLYRNRKQ